MQKAITYLRTGEPERINRMNKPPIIEITKHNDEASCSSTTSKIDAYGDSAALHLTANTHADCVIPPKQTRLIPSGISIRIHDPSIAAVVLAKTNLINKGLTVNNAPGLSNPDYPDEISIITYNPSNQAITIQHGEQIAQLMFIPALRQVQYSAASQLKTLSLHPTKIEWPHNKLIECNPLVS